MPRCSRQSSGCVRPRSHFTGLASRAPGSVRVAPAIVLTASKASAWASPPLGSPPRSEVASRPRRRCSPMQLRLVSVDGFEPPTPCSQSKCAASCATRRIWWMWMDSNHRARRTWFTARRIHPLCHTSEKRTRHHPARACSLPASTSRRDPAHCHRSRSSAAPRPRTGRSPVV